MSIFTGPYKALFAAAAPAAAATWYPCTNTIVGVQGSNTLRLYVTGAVASLGDVDFYVTHVHPGDSSSVAYTRAAAGDGPEVFGPIPFSAVGSFFIDIPIGVPLETIQVYFRIGSVASNPTIAITGFCYLDDSGTSNTEIALGDIEVSMDTLDGIVYAEDTAHTSADPGAMILTVRQDDATAMAGTDGDYQPLSTSEHNCLNVDTQHYYVLDSCDAVTGWTAWGNDTINVAVATNHVFGTKSMEFDKVDGAAGLRYGGIQKTITSVSANKHIEEGGGFLLWSLYVSSLTDIDSAGMRIGTDSSNYQTFSIDDDNLAVGWNNIRVPLTSPASVTGNGWNSAAITYIAPFVYFDAETNALADIAVDNIFLNSGLQVSADIQSQTSVNTPNVNVHRMGGTPVNTGAGAVASATQRVTLGNDDALTAAANVLLGTIDTDTGNIATDAAAIEALDILIRTAVLPTEGTTVDVDFDGSVASGASVAAGGVELCATEDCYYVWGATPTAAAAAPSRFLPAGVIKRETSPGNKIAAIKLNVAGKLSVTPLT